MHPIDRVIEIVGGQEKLASILAIKSPSISGWRMRNRVPAERCIAIERATNGIVTRYDLRPDVFGTPAMVGERG
ncbi:helix-turn-helix domain-containing protein [Luteibacter aegosomatis]|uniref:transcriptional regulator n=1 Tax=Luteibacter aegosomatis TaxID=2911537 RepID=UPI001FFA416B|nr:helix-turn-helix domain-containing protein [Luteibacter aegosomatis]UPG86826.1 helix-turn-helix domain-containing protein [Luteibacter aegosomatis]